MAKATTDSVDESQAPEAGSTPEEQPEEVNTEAAVEDNEGSEPESEEADASEETEESSEEEPQKSELTDDEIKEWADKKGLPLDDPVLLAKNVRELEQKMHQQGQEVGELRKQVGKQAEEGSDEYASPEETEQSRLIAQLKVTDFYLNNPEARSYDEKMAEIVQEKPYLANDLETLLVVAKAKTSDEEVHKARKEGEQAALKRVAKSQRQSAPKTAASDRTDKEPEKDPFEVGFDSVSY